MLETLVIVAAVSGIASLGAGLLKYFLQRARRAADSLEKSYQVLILDSSGNPVTTVKASRSEVSQIVENAGHSINVQGAREQPGVLAR